MCVVVTRAAKCCTGKRPKRSRVAMFDEVVNDALTEQTRAALGVVMNDIAKGHVPASSSI